MSDEVEPDDAPFTRYQNPLYRAMTMGGGALVLLLGIGGAVVSRTLSPPTPMGWTFVDVLITVLLFSWYVLGLRCHLDLFDDRVVVATKLNEVEVPRAEVESIAVNRAWWGVLQPSGRPLTLTTTGGRTIRVIGALPSDVMGQAAAIAELQAELGDPEEVATRELSGRMHARLDGGTGAEHLDEESVAAADTEAPSSSAATAADTEAPSSSAATDTADTDTAVATATDDAVETFASDVELDPGVETPPA